MTFKKMDSENEALSISGEAVSSIDDLLKVLSAQQYALVRALDTFNNTLSSMYYGAILVLENTLNPDRFSQCAHSIRELMEKLPAILNVPTKVFKERLSEKVRNIEHLYVSTIGRSGCYTAEKNWTGNIDSCLCKFLQQLAGFFEWFKEYYPRRRDALNTVLINLDGTGRSLPEQLAIENVNDWEEIREYFISVAHHGKDIEQNEFHQRIDYFERFLLDRLAPKTYDDFIKIDELLQEGAGDA